jgi:hypothetical protein
LPLTAVFNEFKSGLAQCDSLIANAHQVNSAGLAILPLLDRQQITVAAFLNMFIAWEAFLESSLTAFMVGDATLSGAAPVKFVSPISLDAARALIVGANRYFDYGNHDNVKRVVNIYFQNGYPYEPHLSSIMSDLSDLRTMRNASAHITSTTQTALDGLALRVLTRTSGRIDLYALLTAVDPRSASGETIFLRYKNKLVAAADLIVSG